MSLKYIKQNAQPFIMNHDITQHEVKNEKLWHWKMIIQNKQAIPTSPWFLNY